MQSHQIDRTTARALVEAGYMPLRRYIELFGFEDEAPGTAPSLEEMEHAQPKKKSILSQLAELIHHH